MGEGKGKSDSVGSSDSSNSCNLEPILGRKKPRHTYFLRSMSRPMNQDTWNVADFKKLLAALKTSWAEKDTADWKYIASRVGKAQYACKDAFEKKKAEISLFGKLIMENGVTYDYKNDESLRVSTDFWNDTTREKYSIFQGLNGIPDFQDWKLLLRVTRDDQSFAPRPSQRSGKRSRTASGLSEDVSSDDFRQRALLGIKRLYEELKEVDKNREEINLPPFPDNERLTRDDLYDMINILKDNMDAMCFVTFMQDDRELLMGWLHRRIAEFNT